MLRPSRSWVRGLGSWRPRRVPMPAARMITCTDSAPFRRPVVRGVRGAVPRRTGLSTRSALRTSIISLGRSGLPGRGRVREDEIEDPPGRGAVLEVGEQFLEARVALGVLVADPVDVGDRVDQLVAGV